MPTLYDNFERVRQYIDQHQGGGGDMSAYVTKDELSAQSYLTSIPSTYASYNGVYSYLHEMGIYKSNWGCYIDSAVITDSELNGDIAINGVSTWELPTYAAISEMGYLTSIPSEYVTDTELSSTLGDYYTQGEVDNEISSQLRYYYTKTEINNASYVTSSDLPVIDENIIPKENNTYTLGDVSHFYNAAYSKAFYTRISNLTGFENNGNYTGIYVRVGGNNKLDINSNDMRPVSNGNYNLGTQNAKFGATYTTDLYADNIHNFIWTGTSAEYAALSDYTTYQIYMIKEA